MNLSATSGPIRLGVNIDHVATVRNARGGLHPDPLKAALLARKGGADGITAHLREDRRHIRDDDLLRLQEEAGLPLNFEMAATEEMVAIALKIKPNACCLVPEKRQELTTEGGLDAIGQARTLKPAIARLREAGIRVSLFIDPEIAQAAAARALEADIVEFHTGRFCELHAALPDMTERTKHPAAPAEGEGPELFRREFARLKNALRAAHGLGLECHAGHGLDFQTAPLVASLGEVRELNIGHFLIGQALYEGLEHAVRLMKKVIDEASASASGTRRP